MILLLDTNVASYIFKGDSRAADYAPILHGHHLALSFVTIAELFEWAAIRQWGPKQVTRLEQTLKTYLPIPTDLETCRHWAIIRAHRRVVGKPIAAQDAWIAAAALRHQLPLVTHNPGDFQDVPGLDVRSALAT